MKKFLWLLEPYWKTEILIALMNIFATFLSLASPFLAKLIIDKAYPDKNIKLFIVLAGLIAVIFLVETALQNISQYLNQRVRSHLNFKLKHKFSKKLQKLPLEFFQGSSSAEHLYKTSYDIEQIANCLSGLISQAILLVIKSLIIMVILLRLNTAMGLSTLFLLPFLYIGPYYFTKKLKKIYNTWIKDSQGAFKHLQQMLLRMPLIKAFGKEKEEEKNYIEKIIGNTRLKLVNIKFEATRSFWTALANRAVIGLTIIYGGLQIMKNTMTLGTLSAVSIYLMQLVSMQYNLAMFFQQTALGFVSFQRLEEIFQAKDKNVPKNAKEILFSNGLVEFKNIVFSYPPSASAKEEKNSTLIFNGVSFTIEDGKLTAICGPSGYGKTTLINLLLKFYESYQGEIFIGGVNIKNINNNSFYNQIGTVLQELYLQDDTIANNISYGYKNAPIEQIKEAARIACLDDFIENLPKNYDTTIGENAAILSEGQKQRLAIARALIKKPKILILDEAMASLDSETERIIIKNIRQYLDKSTIVVISHRLSTIMAADYAFFINSQREIIKNKPQCLLQSNIFFRNLFSNQAGILR